jgi:hypothetical protein
MARRRQQRVLLPWEKDTRRGFLKKGLVGGALLAMGGAGWLATRRTRPVPVGGPLYVLTPEEAAVVLAVADRLIPPRAGFPRPLEVAVPRKVDGIIAMAHAAAQKEVKRLLHLFENALAGLLFEHQLRTFTASSPGEQDARLASWAHSRVALRRTGYRVLKRLVYAAYYASPETYAAVGYRGPPPVPAANPSTQQQREPAASAPERRPARQRPSRTLAPKPLDVVPEPREGIALPEPKR